MTDPDAYQGEMTDLFGPADEALEGIYAGVAPTEDLEEVAAFMLEVKTTCSASPREEVAGKHLAAMLEESRRTEGTRPLTQEHVVVVARTRWRRAMDRTISTVLKGAAGVLAASMSMMGLAYAGVDLPGQAAANAIEAVTGVELPNQNDGGENGKSVADDVKAVVESDAEKGCEFGQAVAAAASQNAQGDGPGSEEACTDEDEGTGEPQGSKATGDEKSAEGRATASEKSGGASEAGADNATTGTDRAGSGADNATTGKSTAEEKTSGAGTDDTDDTDDSDDGAADGQGTASEKSGGASDAGSDRRP